MGIGEQFAGLDMKNLIGGPLSAAADASIQLAQSTADFINKVGFDSEDKARTVQFNFQRMEPDEDGSINQSDMKVQVPLLAIVPIPNLQIDEVNVMFDMEVKQCEKSESGTDISASISGGLNLGLLKVNVSGSVASHSTNTRSSDNSAKYHVDVVATNHGTPEGLARVLDMMAANVAPQLISSRAVDESGNALDGSRNARNLQMRTLREKKFQLESSLRAASEIFDSKLKALISKGDSIQNAERLELLRPGEEISDADLTEEQREAAKAAEAEKEAKLLEISTGWTNFNNRIKGIVAAACDTANQEGSFAIENAGQLAQHIQLVICAPFSDDSTACSELQTIFCEAVTACNEYKTANNALNETNVEYNKVIMRL